MEWTEFPWGGLISIGLLMLSVALLAMDERNRRKFASKSDVCTPDGKAKFVRKDEMEGFSKRIDQDIAELKTRMERRDTFSVQMDDRLGRVEGDLDVIKERQIQQWERIGDQMKATAETISSVTIELKEISRMQQEHALRLERLHREKNDHTG